MPQGPAFAVGLGMAGERPTATTKTSPCEGRDDILMVSQDLYVLVNRNKAYGIDAL